MNDLPLSFLLCAGFIGFALFCAGYIVGVSSVLEDKNEDL